MVKDIIVKISDYGTAKAKNNIAKYSYTIQSPLSDDSQRAYKELLPTVLKIKKILSGQPLTTNTKIDYRIEPDYEYEPKKKLLGYKGFASITYDFKLEGDVPQTEKASSLQMNIMAAREGNSQILLDRIGYTLSEIKRKDIELMAIKKAIEYAKRKAQFIVQTTYGQKSYVIVNTEVSTNGYFIRDSQARGMYANASASQTLMEDVISQGESEIKATVTMEIQVTN